jgi:non-specific serine/threonine protein kinase
VGKTRLAREVGVRVGGCFGQGVVFVDLTPTRDAHLVPARIAHALGLPNNGQEAPLTRLARYLRERHLLLILDNFEQVISAAGEIAQLLGAAPLLRILVTSRIVLRLRWEKTIRVEPLGVPDADTTHPLDALLRLPSVALFVERAQAQRADFTPTEQQASLLVQLIRQLDGLPLAIELAAARMSALPLAVIVHRLEQRLQALRWDAHDVPVRHRSLQAAIDWSYDLLTEAEQRLFRHLGVFVGQVSLEAIEAVAGEGDVDEGITLAGLAGLAEKSLVSPGQLDDDNPEPSFGMLETVREYSCDQLSEHGELDAARRAHARYFLNLAERAEPELNGCRQNVWYQRLEREHDNLRAALHWLLDRGHKEEALRLASALGRFWWTRGYHSEAWHWFEQALTSDADPALRTKALPIAGRMPVHQGGLDRSQVALEEALALAKERQAPHDIAEAFTHLGVRAVIAAELNEGVRLLNEALRRWQDLGESGNDFQVGTTLLYLSAAAVARRDFQEAASFASRALCRHEASGNIHTASAVRPYLAVILQQLGDLPRAVQLVRETLQGSRVCGDRWILTLGVEATLLLAGERANAEERARLVGAVQALRHAPGLTFGLMGQWFGRSLPIGYEQCEHEGVAAAYREGRSLSFSEIANLAEAILQEFSQTLTEPQAAVQDLVPENPLSPREQEVLRLVADGHTSKQIGQQLFLSPRTVEHHVTSVFNKLAVDTRAQAVAVAAREGLV